MSRPWYVPVFLALILCFASAGPLPANLTEQADVTRQLEAALPGYMEKIRRTLLPSENQKAVRPENGSYVASFLRVDQAGPQIDITPGTAAGEYVARVSYVIHEFQARGATEQEALSGPFRKVKSRRMREYLSFSNGKWSL